MCKGVKVLDSLKLNDKNIAILKKELEILGKSYNAIHIRVESDWSNQWAKTPENLLIDLYYKSEINQQENSLFFSTGEKHNEIKDNFNKLNIKNHTFESSELLYDLKTAISYTICLLSNHFISNTYSTFSSLITMQRELIYKNNNNFSYNNNSIYKRVDKGLHYKKVKETNKNAANYVEIVDFLD